MSATSEHDQITYRLVNALDALPVPEEPTGLSVTAKPSLAGTPTMLLAVGLLVALVATLTSAQFQDAAGRLEKYIERIVVGPAWVGYYHDHNSRDVDGRPTLRLVIASDHVRGAPTTPDIFGEYTSYWGWSPDREHMLVAHGNQIYLGDPSGRLRPIADVGPGYYVDRMAWAGNDKVWATVFPMRGPAAGATPEGSFVSIDLKTGVLERQVLDDLPDQPMGLTGWGRLGSISPDGRWLSVFDSPPPGGSGAACGSIGALYDLTTRQTIDPVDASGRQAAAFGFLGDGRIVLGRCDRSAGTLELHVGSPGGRPSLIAIVPLAARFPVVSLGNSNDEILVITSGPEAQEDAYVFDPSGRLLRRHALPKLALAGVIESAGLSSDGRFMGFEVGQPFGNNTWRAGVVDLKTGEVTYLCDTGCDYLFLR